MFDLNRICTRLDLDPLAQGLQIVNAGELARDFFPRLDTDRPALIANISTLRIARAARRTLLVNFPPQHQLTLIDGENIFTRTLNMLARQSEFTESTVVFVPSLPQSSSPQSLAALVARLRAPRGCPWDREQTHQSLRRALLEETYEVLEALDENDPAKLREEIGDLFLHVLFQIQIAREQDEFTFAQVGAQLAAKLIRRHPHVFGDVQVNSAQDVVENWERIKKQEKEGSKGNERNALDANIPRELPALTRAQKVYARAKRAGISQREKNTAEPLAQKILRERDRARKLGEALFALAQLAEEHHLDAESALRQATARFVEDA